MRIVGIGDIGVVDDMIHIGDEAMFEALVDAIGSRGVDDVTTLSSHPAETAARYGIGAIARIGFDGDRASQLDRRDRVLRAARGERGALAGDDPALTVLDAVAAADGVVIAGGGNMSSLWPHHIFERATLGGIAEITGTPLVVSGQTIGPDLVPHDAGLVADLLSSARLVGLRERNSFDLVSRLGVRAPIERTVDDASYLVDDDPDTAPYCLVSLASHTADADRGTVALALAALLDEVVDSTGLEVRFLPHFASVAGGPSRGDSVMHDRVATAMRSSVALLSPTDAKQAARAARSASLVVSSRYHPVVFAVPAGVPAVGIPVDEYTRVKLEGALGNFGQSGVLPVRELLDGAGSHLLGRVWTERDMIRDRAARLSPERRAASNAWWDRVVASLS
jgi:polysaccharide pyruvyl transferase WcaK-like protein